MILVDILILQIGLAKLFGINLMENFNYPYFSINIGDFGRDGIFLSPLGLETTYIFHLVAQKSQLFFP